MPAGTWVMQRCESERFPYRIQIIQAGKPWLTLRVQDRWPGAGQNIFCLREKEAPDDVIGEVESVPILALQRRGPRISVVLDRARQKRCDFLALVKQSSKGTYEQIFWQTQQALRQRRSGARLVPTKSADFSVRIASEERYPWRFPGKTVVRGRLAVGDYALLGDDDVLAVVERKTFDNLLADFGVMAALHQQLLELSACRNHSLVIEAPYEDFLTPTKLHHFSATFCARAIAELYAAHPALRIVFCSNRKLANLWTQHFFTAVWAQAQQDISG